MSPNKPEPYPVSTLGFVKNFLTPAMTRQKFDKGFFRCGSLEKNDVQTQRTVSPEKNHHRAGKGLKPTIKSELGARGTRLPVFSGFSESHLAAALFSSEVKTLWVARLLNNTHQTPSLKSYPINFEQAQVFSWTRFVPRLTSIIVGSWSCFCFLMLLPLLLLVLVRWRAGKLQVQCKVF